MMEGLLDPKAMLRQLVQQKERTWLQIGSNTMDSMNSNDPMKQILDNIPTWDKVCACITLRGANADAAASELLMLRGTSTAAVGHMLSALIAAASHGMQDDS
jgi:hypothetical protein